VGLATTGSVEFFDGATSLGTAPVESTGLARLTTAALGLGDHTLTAAYGGSVSSPIVQTIRDATNSFWFSSGWGFDTLGDGATESFSAPDESVSVQGDLTYAQLNAFSGTERWFVGIHSFGSQPLQAGSYPSVNTANSPGLTVSGVGSSCPLSGSLDISNIQADESGNVFVLDASFVVNCGGAFSIPSFSGTIHVAPARPTAPQHPTAAPKDGAAVVHWDPPAYGGSTPVTQYVITGYIGLSPVTVRTFAADATTRIVGGLVNGRTYRFKVEAKNSLDGPQSIPTNAVTVGAPAAPTDVSASAGARAAAIHWTVPANNGAAINGYVIWPYINGIAQPSRTFAGPASGVTFAGLSSGTTYTFKVAARNARGTGPQSAPTNAVRPT
jgi:hypothetical protein